MTSHFQSRVVLTGYIHCKKGTRLQHQAENRRHSPDLYVLKDLSGMPYISGSNFKNFLRKQVETLLLETLGSSFSCENACIKLGEPQPDNGIYLQDLIDRCGDDDSQLFEAIERHTCLSCKLFGSQLVESQIISEDLKPSAWSSRIKQKKGMCIEAIQEMNEQPSVPEKFMIRVVLENCEPWKRGLFIMGLSRAQNKLISLSASRQTEPQVATIEGLTVRSLESARHLYERLSKHEATDGADVTTEQLQHWINSLRDYLKLVAGYALAS